jgi:hypothetical protein
VYRLRKRASFEILMIGEVIMVQYDDHVVDEITLERRSEDLRDGFLTRESQEDSEPAAAYLSGTTF